MVEGAELVSKDARLTESGMVPVLWSAKRATEDSNL
jgi:hypothetical protein